jgi:hypothetical protein
MSADAMRMHIERLLAQHEIHCHWIGRRMRFAEAWRKEEFGFVDRIRTPRITGERTYGLALHEIGHILGACQNSPDVMTYEREAWKWARANALKWTPKMERFAAQCLLSYERSEQEARTREAELHTLLAKAMLSHGQGDDPAPGGDRISSKPKTEANGSKIRFR